MVTEKKARQAEALRDSYKSIIYYNDFSMDRRIDTARPNYIQDLIRVTVYSLDVELELLKYNIRRSKNGKEKRK